MANLRIRAPLACRLAHVDRDRFNEAVARGDYPCAPPATPGRTRTFSVHDVVGLFVFGRLVERGMAAKLAGEYACEVSGYSRSIPGDATDVGVCRVQTTVSTDYFIVGNLDDARKAEIAARLGMSVISPFAQAMTSGKVLCQENWQIHNIRKIIADGIEDYRNTLGEEEEIG